MSTPNVDEMKNYASQIIPHLNGLSPINGKRVLDYVKTQLDKYSVIDSMSLDATEDIETA